MAGETVAEVTNDAPEGGVANALLAAVQRMILLQDNGCLSAGGAADATSAAKVKTVATVTYRVNGAQLTKGATDNLWTLTGATLTAGQVNKWLLCLDASGTASVVEGIHSTTAAGVTFADVVGADGHTYPAPGPNLCVAAQLTVTCNSSTFVPGTTSLAAGTITVVYRDGYEDTMTGAVFPVTYGN